MPNPNFPNNPGYNLYVGARYIPLFDGDWDAAKKYEPITVVVYQGNTYTSKTYVPAGVLPTNDTYWALSANYNAQIEQLSQKVDTFDGRIKENAENIEANKTNADTKIAANEAMINANDAAIKANAANIATNTNSITANTNSIATLTDSLTKYWNTNGSRVVTVGAAGAQFATVNQAVDFGKQYIADNGGRVTVLIYPGTYQESVNVGVNPGLDFIGVGNVLIQDGPEYPISPFTISSGQTLVKNIKFTSTSTTYALHCEAGTLDSAFGSINFEGCTFYASQHIAAGIGLGELQDVNFKDCIFQGEATASCFIHTRAKPTQLQIVTLDNCRFAGKTGVSAIWIADSNKGEGNSLLQMHIKNCNFQGEVKIENKNPVITAYPTDQLMLMNDSVGNNVPNLTYGYMHFEMQFSGTSDAQNSLYIPMKLPFPTSAYTITTGLCYVDGMQIDPSNITVVPFNDSFALTAVGTANKVWIGQVRFVAK